MGLKVDYLEVKDFRNYEWFLLELAESLTIISGRNAAGKTNLIEALQLLTMGESFRRPRWDELVGHSAEQCRINLVASGDNREITVVMDVERGQGRTYRLNGTKKRTVSAATGTIPCVVFTPNDLFLAKGSSSARREPLDSLGSQLSATYDALRRDYAKVLRHRNAALKDRAPEDQLAVWTETLAATGTRLIAHRERLLERMRPHVRSAYGAIAAGEDLEIAYRRSWDRQQSAPVTREDAPGEGEDAERIREAFESALGRSADEERARATTVVGPHRDDVEITIAGVSARDFASQGQQRSTALAWKLGEVEVVREVSDTQPLLLLDDVMSELDEPRRHALAARVVGSAQTVMTTTNLHYFDQGLLDTGTVVSLDGRSS